MIASRLLVRRSLPSVLLFLVAGLLAVFFLPYHVAVAPAVSDSYVFGFSNRAALFLFLVFVTAFAYWSGGLGLVVREPEDEQVSPPLSRRLGLVTVGLTGVITVAFWAAYRSGGGDQ